MSDSRNGATTPEPVRWEHLAQFYDTQEFLSGAVADFLSDGLIAGEPVVVLATSAHTDAFAEKLSAAGLDWEEARRSKRLKWVDARTVLEAIMIGRVPDPDRFDQHIGALIRGTLNGAQTRVRAYGELVDLLWQEGNPEAALRLEDMWNDLGRTHSFTLLCAYSRGNIYRESRGFMHREICDRHALVLPAET